LKNTLIFHYRAYEDYFKNAQKVRTLVQQDFDGVFKFKNLISTTEANAEGGVDVILAPTTFSPPPSRDNLPKGVNAYTNDVFTVPSSLAGKII
jgi:aspartyl-tRNA(Asn)/glutamyl-tRNA(Gln) amidotransferase subunit A